MDPKRRWGRPSVKTIVVDSPRMMRNAALGPSQDSSGCSRRNLAS